MIKEIKQSLFRIHYLLNNTAKTVDASLTAPNEARVYLSAIHPSQQCIVKKVKRLKETET